MFVVVERLHVQMAHQKLALHLFGDVLRHRANRRMLMTELAGKSSRLIHSVSYRFEAGEDLSL